MALKNKQPVHRTAKGKKIDMDMLRARHELTPAVGNARVNARGDELGPGGEIVRSREDIVKEYYDSTSNATQDEKRMPKAPVVSAVEEKAAAKPKAISSGKSRAQKKVDEQIAEPTATELAEFDDMDAEWVEDENGDFVQKGDL
jgi:hypothetical protein